MIVKFQEKYLKELYEDGQASDKNKTIAEVVNITELSNHYK